VKLMSMNDLVSEYQQYQDASAARRRASTRRRAARSTRPPKYSLLLERWQHTRLAPPHYGAQPRVHRPTRRRPALHIGVSGRANACVIVTIVISACHPELVTASRMRPP